MHKTTPPQETTQIPSWMWEMQNTLNAVSHPHAKGTLAYTPEEKSNILQCIQDYEAALLSEVSELQDNFFWKHWSTEAREGYRWAFIDGSAQQNLIVEAIDIAFFLMSILHLVHCLRPECAVDELWAKEAKHGWGHPPAVQPACAQHINNIARDCLAHTLNIRPTLEKDTSEKTQYWAGKAIRSYFSMVQAFLTLDTWAQAYGKKLLINFNRMERGRKQVGDPHAEEENKLV